MREAYETVQAQLSLAPPTSKTADAAAKAAHQSQADMEVQVRSEVDKQAREEDPAALSGDVVLYEPDVPMSQAQDEDYQTRLEDLQEEAVECKSRHVLQKKANGAELTRAYCDHAGGRKPLRGWLTLVRSRPRSQCAAAGYAHWWRVHRVPSLARVKDSPV
jgi:hypothetical protein